jgi:hypothetical protein
MPDLPAYTWASNERQFRDASGRFVSRAEVRGALDSYLDTVTAEIRDVTQSLVDGSISIEDWHLRMERAIKEAHTSAGAIAAGGWNQATSADWAQVGRKVKFQYQHLRDFARELENGLPLGPGIVSRAEMYGISATGTYEAVLRNGDLANGYDLERRILHSERSCTECVRYAAMDWQPAGVLPGIGEQCSCMSNCRCTFDRQRSRPRARRKSELVS